MKILKKIVITGTLSLLCLTLLNGCMSFNPRSLRTMERALIASNPDLEIESEFTIGVGALTIDFIDFAFIKGKSFDISKISKAEIAIYELENQISLSNFHLPEVVFNDSRCSEQQVVIKVREDNELVQIVACIKDEQVTGITVFVLAPREIVIVKARGNFEAMLAAFVKDARNRESERSEDSVQT